jgi:hypothetical protein
MQTETTLEARHVSVSIERPPDEVYRFAANAQNLSRWASGLGAARQSDGDEWIVEGGPMRQIKVRFAEHNRLGVLDHDVTLPSGVTVHNPFRVVPNGAGSEVVFSVFRQPGMSETEFERDAQTIEKDLGVLKRILEERG